MPTSLIVVDDFFADAQGFREAGLRLTYPAPEAGQEQGKPTYFPGGPAAFHARDRQAFANQLDRWLAARGQGRAATGPQAGM